MPMKVRRTSWKKVNLGWDLQSEDGVWIWTEKERAQRKAQEQGFRTDTCPPWMQDVCKLDRSVWGGPDSMWTFSSFALLCP